MCCDFRLYFLCRLTTGLHTQKNYTCSRSVLCPLYNASDRMLELFYLCRQRPIYSLSLCHALYITLGKGQQACSHHGCRCTGGLPLFGSTTLLISRSLSPADEVRKPLSLFWSGSVSPVCVCFRVQRYTEFYMYRYLGLYF